jgi:hypothetical protein
MLDDIKGLTSSEREHAHAAAGMLRDAVAQSFRNSAAFEGAQLIETCQWEDIGAEALYVLHQTGVIMRVRFEPIETDDLPAFLNGEPGMNVQKVTEPQDYLRAMLRAVKTGDDVQIIRD